MLAKVQVQERTIRVALPEGTERTVTFPTAIAQVVGFREVVAVRCEPDAYTMRDRNVFGVTDVSGEVWRVDARIAGSVCTEIAAQAERLVASLSDGRVVALDPMTGKLL